MLAPWLLIPLLVLGVPFAVLLLLLVQAGSVYAAVHRSPERWLGWLTRAGCLVSMGFAVAYGGLMVAIDVGPVFGDDTVEGWGIFLTWCAASLIIGFLATWGTWRWLKR